MTKAFPRRAEFIWRPRDLSRGSFWQAVPRLPEEANRYVHFRHVFHLAQAPEAAPVWVTADGRYQLFVNGVLVGRGPSRNSAACRSLDQYDLAGHLHQGENIIAALAHSYGRNTAWYELPTLDHGRAFGCGGFFLQGEVTSGANNLCLDSDGRWRCRTATAWARDVPSNSIGFMECFDARFALAGWTEADFDDADWENAEVLRVGGRGGSGDVVPFQFLLPDDIPRQQEGPVVTGRIVSCREVLVAPEEPGLAARMDKEIPLPLDACRANMDGSGILTVPGRAVTLVVDFGEVVAGYIRFELAGPAGAQVDFYPGEQMLPDGRVLIYDGIPGYDSHVAHRYILKQGRQSWERFEWNGLRYLQITVRDATESLTLRRIEVNQTGYPVEARGRLECSDETLTRLWQAGARTLRLCMFDAYVDCPSREQRQWMDAYLDARINYAAFGDTLLAARLIRQLASSQRPEGLTTMAAPGDFSVAGFSNIPDFCLYWIMAAADYVLYSGDDTLADEVYPSVARALQWFERYVNDEDLLTEVPLWVFVEWAETDKKGQVTAFNAQYVAALRAAAELARLAGHLRGAARYLELAGRVEAAINRLLWDEERGVYADARRHGRLSRRISQQSNAAVIAHGIAPRERWERMFDIILDESRLVLTHGLGRDGQVTPFDESRQVVMAQPFYSHFLHRALRADGRFETILENIRRRWSALLAVGGGSTFPETWQVEAITSTCHAWSATPTFDLSTDILGVSPLAPGFRRLRIAPQTAGLQWARGTYPTPHGNVAVDWTNAEGIFELAVEVPTGCAAEVACTLSGGWVEVDGRPASSVTAMLGEGRHRLRAGS